MCGVFGFVSATGKGPDLDLLDAIAVNTESRGKHAHGLAWSDNRGRLRSYKSTGRISRNLRCLDYVRDARLLIGHCRYATRGAFTDNINNHPHPCDGGWIVHNGTVFNHQQLAKRHELARSGECDSEVIGLLVESLEGTLLERVTDAVNLLEGPGVVLGVWTRPSRLVVVRRGKPLHLTQTENGDVYFASLPDVLDDPDRVLDNTVRSISVKNGTVTQTIGEVVSCPKRKREKSPQLGRPSRQYKLDWNDELRNHATN